MKHEQFGKHLNFYDDDGNLIAMGSAFGKLDETTANYMYKMIESAYKEAEERKKQKPEHIIKREGLITSIKSIENEIEHLDNNASYYEPSEELDRRNALTDSHTELLFRLRDSMTAVEMRKLYNVYVRWLISKSRARGYSFERFERSLDFYFSMDVLKGLE